MESTYNWNFPLNNGGQIRGFADAGFETFGKNKIDSLIREICQNSMDAVYDPNLPVKVEFNRTYEAVNNMPGYQEFKNYLEKCNDFWGESESVKSKDYLQNAVANMRKKSHCVLRISDYNTIGLESPYKNSFTGWNALTKIDGGATKNGDTGGSFGIGKNAPFCFSNYRVVFYRTYNLARENAAQGMSRLMSFPLGDNYNDYTTGIGYYGNVNGNMPVYSIEDLDRMELRKEVGTDVFIYGFTVDGEEWLKTAIVAVLENFLVAIHKGKLSVVIQNQEINKETLKSFVTKYKLDLKHAYFNYEALTSDKKTEKVFDFHGLGQLRLNTIISDKEKKDQQVLFVRSSGMRIFYLKRIAKQLNFSGVLELEGVQLNTFFRAMETPAHDIWETSRHDDPKRAKEYYKEVKDIVRKFILEQIENSSDEEMDVGGLSDLLLDDTNDLTNNEENRETLSEHLSIVQIDKTPRHSDSTHGLFYGSGGTNKSKYERKKGTITGKGTDEAMRTLSGSRTRSKRQKHKGKENVDGRDIILKPVGGDTNIVLNNTRLMYLGNESYKISFNLPRDVNKGYMELVTVGENGKNNLVKISEVLSSSIALCKEGHGYIYFENVESDVRHNIKFTISGSQLFAMEVHVYEVD